MRTLIKGLITVVKAVCILILVLAWAWGAAALFFSGPGPYWLKLLLTIVFNICLRTSNRRYRNYSCICYSHYCYFEQKNTSCDRHDIDGSNTVNNMGC